MKPTNEDLRAVLASALKSRTALQVGNRSGPFWPASHFKLDGVTVFRESSAEERSEILNLCGASLMAEAYFIEKFGMYFAARMSLLAESDEERMLFSLFASDEAVHFNWISGFVSQGSIARHEHDPFILFLDEVLRREDRLTLGYIVQVILEGWGLSHYRALASDCECEELKSIFENIIRDEARHHRSGVVLFNEREVSLEEIEKIVSVLARLFMMVQVGPQMIASQIEKVKGRLSTEQKIKLFEELSCGRETTKKIETLTSLIRSASHAEIILDRLERNGSLRAFSASECAASV
ncbi:MAG: ferritin-like domain-containing protein [Acidobacteriota bacterium]